MFRGVITKRAQIPFSSWLPAAMAAPTPVSSLVHSSTLVTAGIYLIIRYNFLFFKFYFVFSISLLTMILAGLGASMEKDFKKLVAISTLRQLGIISLIICLGFWKLSFFHISFHSFFKSILFLSTGFLISRLEGGQDSRYLSGSFSRGWRFLFVLIRSVSLIGFPFTLGFFSKDLIMSFYCFFLGGSLLLVFMLGCAFTVAYRIRFINICFIEYYMGVRMLKLRYKREFVLPSLILIFFCVFSGRSFFWVISIDSFYFFRLTDYVSGIAIILFGGLIWKLLNLTKKSFYGTYNMFFLFWIGRGGVTPFMGRIVLWIIDSSWIEVRGGRGMYNFLNQLGKLSIEVSTLFSKFFLFIFPVFIFIIY